MVWESKAEIAGAVIALAVGGLFIKSWADNRELVARAEEQKKASTAIIVEQQKLIQEKQTAIAQRDQAAARQEEQIASLARALKTPQQAARALPQVSNLPAQPREVKAADLAPGAPAVAKAGDYVLPAESMLPLVQELAQCKQDGIKLGACQLDLKDTTSSMWAYQKQYDAELETAKKWELAARGGSLAKQRAAGAAIGAGAGGILCSLF